MSDYLLFVCICGNFFVPLRAETEWIWKISTMIYAESELKENETMRIIGIPIILQNRLEEQHLESLIELEWDLKELNKK